jgi:tRNA-2-methylthio-N6-dimethylallyladenosine synthase
LEKIDRLRSSTRDIALTTDIIVGFPGETESDFQDTVKMVEYCGFDAAYIFKYSPRPETPAYAMADDVSPAEKTLRFLELEKAQRRIQAQRLERYPSRILKVLAEGSSSRKESVLTGHSTCHKVVNFNGSRDLRGKVVDVRITEVKANSLFGEVI